MKKLILLTFFLLALMTFPLISAEGKIIINQEPNEIYNLEDSITVPVTVVPVSDISDEIYMHLLCTGRPTIEICHDGISLSREEGGKVKECTLLLTKDKIGEITGSCTIRVYLSKEIPKAVKTEEFKISNLLTVQPNTDQKIYEPGQILTIYGSAIKENGKDVNGYIDVEILIGNASSNIAQMGTITNGRYSIDVTLPSDMKAGNYLVKLNAYEMIEGEVKTNKGFVNYNIAIKQVPTYLEIALETNKVEPGTNIKAKAILHDQTGEKIDSNAIITIKRGTSDIQIQTEKPTDEYLEFPIKYNEPASGWTVFAVSNQLTAELTFEVIESEKVEITMTNETVIFSNKGNVPYNKTVIIKIGKSYEDVPIYLEVDETKKYELRAPDGEYEIEIVSEGESALKQNVALTGKAIEIKDLSKLSIGNFFGEPLVIIFIILVFLAAAFIFLRKKYDRDFYKRIFKKKTKQPKVNTAWENRAVPLSKNSRLETRNKAQLSISMKGEKTDVDIVNLKIKNFKEIQSKKGNEEETLQKIVNGAESKKAFVYESQDNISFILTPSKTKTFKNEMTAMEIAQNAKKILTDHNRIFKNKIDFGISMEHGSIIEKTEGSILTFMGLGDLMTNIRRIASLSDKDVLMGEKIKEKMVSVRAEKYPNDRVKAYKIKEVKYHDEAHSRFIKSFLKRAGEDKK